MADNIISVPLPRDLPENWNDSQYVSPGGTEVGLTEKHGYNYLMKQVNNTQKAAKELEAAIGVYPYSADLHTGMKNSIVRTDKDTLNTPFKAGLTTANVGICVVAFASPSYTTLLFIPASSSNLFIQTQTPDKWNDWVKVTTASDLTKFLPLTLGEVNGNILTWALSSSISGTFTAAPTISSGLPNDTAYWMGVKEFASPTRINIRVYQLNKGTGNWGNVGDEYNITRIDGAWTTWKKSPTMGDLANYLPTTGGKITGQLELTDKLIASSGDAGSVQVIHSSTISPDYKYAWLSLFANKAGTNKLTLQLRFPVNGQNDGGFAKLEHVVNGVAKYYDLYGDHNKPTPAMLGAAREVDGAVVSDGFDYAICFEWSDGNPLKEKRLGRFVQLTDGGNKISFAKADSDVIGVTTDTAGFVENYGIHSAYTSLVGVLGLVSVVDNGKCTVGQCCMPDAAGYAVPSDNNMGYRVMSRIDSTHVRIMVKPNDDAVQRNRTDMTNVQNAVSSHTQDKKNPHGVTAEQTGAYTKSEVDSKDTNIMAAKGNAAGTATALTLAKTGFTLTDGAKVRFKLPVAIGSNATLNVNGTGAKPLKYPDGTPVSSGAVAGSWLEAIYSSTLASFILLDKGGGGGSSGRAFGNKKGQFSTWELYMTGQMFNVTQRKRGI